MKKTLFFSLAIVLAFAVFTGCKSNDVGSLEDNSSVSQPSDEIIDLTSMAQYLFNYSDDQNQVIASVNSEPLYYADFIMLKRQNEVSCKNGLAALESMPIEEGEKESLREQYRVQTDEEIINRMIRSKVQLLEASKLGIEVSDEAAYIEAQKNYNDLKNNYYSSDESVRNQATPDWNLIQAYMQVFDMNEEQYLQKSAESMKNVLIKSELFNHVQANFTEDEKQNPQQAFETYMDHLINQYKIIRY